ncbi:MAG: DoxX family protein [Candidatus Pacebacteria bacterium]|nr:DoxX family protein [Candidatus Paceibacterota bacterium]MCF7863069.1 DoxX family protein [Candidatus Paceibacterota bacterium]
MDLLKRLHNVDLGTFLVRLLVGVVFIYAGLMKVNNIDMVAGFFQSLGFGTFLAYFVSWAELAGGILVLLGLFTRKAGVVLAVIMAVAMFKVHFANGFSLATNGYEYVFVLLLASLSLVFLGSGKYSVDYLFSKLANKNSVQ